jgi:predicted methyltransferase
MRVKTMTHGVKALGAAGLLMAGLGFGPAATAQTSPALRAAQTHKISAPQVVDDPVLVEVLKGPQRPAADVSRDGARHPLESLTFWGLRPGATVLELFPGAGYWVRILAPYASRTHGHYITTVSALTGDEKDGVVQARVDKFKARWADASVYGDIAYAPMGNGTKQLAAPGSVDLILTARNIHNLLWQKGELDRDLGLAFAALKPGGVFAVEEHRADPRAQIGDARDGYVATATVIAAAVKAGFVFDGASEVNANPKDTKDHPFGVWTLPPERQSAEDGKAPTPTFDRAKYDAIGESDRMTLRFRKPAG